MKMIALLMRLGAATAAFGWVVGVSDTGDRPQKADVMYYVDSLVKAGHTPVVLPYTADTNRIANAPAHVVKLAPGSRFAREIGAADLAVNSHHHQSVGKVAPGFRAVGMAPDGVVEAIEGVNYPAFAVQFHAESVLANDARHPGFDKARLLKIFREIPALVDCGGSGRVVADSPGEIVATSGSSRGAL